MSATLSTLRQQATAGPRQQHPFGGKARVLLSSVFGPYGRDDDYGSRALNPMELYHNQVTRTQGPFSLRMFHRSWGLMLIQANLQAPCTLLDFPTLDRFVEEIRAQPYDIVGISSIVSNLPKVQAMCQLVRRHRPEATIVVGGHISNVPQLERQIDADQIVRGDGVRWFREYLGEDAAEPLRHPLIESGIGTRCLGVSVRERPGDVAATLIPSVGCPLGCNFCSTSAMFGGKGRFVGPPADWGKHYSERIQALNMNFQEVAVGQAATLWAELQSAADRKEPIVLFNWTPNFIEAKFKGEFVDFPDPSSNPKCKDQPAYCGAPKRGYLKKAAAPELEKKWPKAFAILQKVNFTNPDIAKAAAMVDVDGMTPEDAAKKWVAENEATWKPWVQ